MNTKQLLALLAFGFATANCTQVESHGSFVPDAPYSQFATFSFAPNEGAPGGYHLSARSLVVVEQMKPIVAAALEKKGYAAAPEGAGDIIVACGAGRRDVHEERRLNQRVAAISGEDSEDHDFVEGGVVIDAFDKSGGQIWHGAARTPVDPQKPSAERVRVAVNAALERFPARPPH